MPAVLKTAERQRSVSSNLISSAIIRALSSAGRAPALQAGGQEFDPPRVHQIGLVAQLGERRPVTPKAAGSKPVKTAIHCGVSSAVEPLVYTEKVGSSILSPRTKYRGCGVMVATLVLEASA